MAKSKKNPLASTFGKLGKMGSKGMPKMKATKSASIKPKGSKKMMGY